jgi:hypothetical protein
MEIEFQLKNDNLSFSSGSSSVEMICLKFELKIVSSDSDFNKIVTEFN